MGRAKHITIEEKMLAIRLHTKGFNCTFIAKELNLSRNPISKLINSWKRGELDLSKQKRTRKFKLTAQQIFKILNYFIKNPFHTYGQCVKDLKLSVCKRTIANVLKGNGIRNRVGCPKQLLTLRNQIKRLRFALHYQHWTTDEWKRVAFLDEKSVQSYLNGKLLVKRKASERYDSDKLAVTETQNAKNKVNLVGVVSFSGPNMIYSVGSNLKGIGIGKDQTGKCS